MNAHRFTETKNCPPAEDVVALALNDDRDLHRALESHLSQCASCRNLLQQTLSTREQLIADRDYPSTDLRAAIMQKLPADDWLPTFIRLPRSYDRKRFLQLAAGIMVLLGCMIGLTQTKRQEHEPTPSMALQNGREWLLENQNPNGGWNAAQLGGNPEFTEALNGLAIMAIIAAREKHQKNLHPQSLKHAYEHLVSHQSENGLISRSPSVAMYNHGIATLALLEAERVAPSTDLQKAIGKAILAICKSQTVAGGWGYRADARAAPNTSVTAWQIKALLQARTQGHSVETTALRQALNWIAGTINPQGQFGYQGPHPANTPSSVLTLMGAHCLFAAQDTDLMNDPQLKTSVRIAIQRLANKQRSNDYHQAFFLATVLDQLDDTATTDNRHQIRSDLLMRQIQKGGDSGAWLASGDRWGSTGGKLYSTAMAMLAL